MSSDDLKPPLSQIETSDLLLSPDLSPAQAEEFLRTYGFQDPAGADRRLQSLADQVSDRRTLAVLLESVLGHLRRAADPDEALLQLERFFEASVSGDALLAYLNQNEAGLEVLCTLFGASPFLSQLLLRSPEYFYWLMGGDRLQELPLPGYFAVQAEAAAGVFSEPEHALDALRRFHRREYLRIALQDLLGIHSFSAIVQQISDLADALLQAVFKLLFPLYGEAEDSFAVIGMGKLGGAELNFSSDVDLLYVYADHSRADRMARFARHFTRALSEATAEGRLYRVDLRLRPMGSGGEIVYPLSAYRRYWETGAETFERLALIKARPVAGDMRLGLRFVEVARAFVYRKYLDQAALEEVAYLKRRSERSVHRKSGRRNVKLGVGGIREVEFFTQALQILYGGAHPQLQQVSTLTALDRLLDLGLLEKQDYESLKQAYVFLRTLEHRLQLVHDRQVQVLPSESAALRRLMRQMSDVQSPGQFERVLRQHQSRVHAIYQSLFEGEENGGLHQLLLDPSADADAARKVLEQAGISRPERLWQALDALKRSPSFPHSPARMRNLLANLLPAIIEFAAPLRRPEQFVNRLDRFCESLGSRVPMYQELVEHSALARRLFNLLASGEFLAETLIRHPELLDTLASPETLAPASPESYPAFDWPRPRSQDAAADRALFKRREEFKTAVGELEGASTHQARMRLSRLAEQCLRSVCEDWVSQRPEFGRSRWGLFALGKLGGFELTYQSDLDLALFYDPVGTDIPATEWDALVRYLKRELEAYTVEGRCFQLDFRLRPWGRKSAPATPLPQVQAYFSDRAQGWERLAYTKLRCVYARGEPILPDSLLRPRPLSEEELQSAIHLRRRKELELARESEVSIEFKLGTGGILDIQLMVETAQLESGLEQVNTRLALQALKSDYTPLPTLEDWDFWCRLESRVRLLSGGSSNRLQRGDELSALAARSLGLSGSELWDACMVVRRRVRRGFLDFFSARLGRRGET